jgi:hypothetical protein
MSVFSEINERNIVAIDYNAKFDNIKGDFTNKILEELKYSFESDDDLCNKFKNKFRSESRNFLFLLDGMVHSYFASTIMLGIKDKLLDDNLTPLVDTIMTKAIFSRDSYVDSSIAIEKGVFRFNKIVYLSDSGSFYLETDHEQIICLINDFMRRNLNTITLEILDELIYLESFFSKTDNKDIKALKPKIHEKIIELMPFLQGSYKNRTSGYNLNNLDYFTRRLV